MTEHGLEGQEWWQEVLWVLGHDALARLRSSHRPRCCGKHRRRASAVGCSHHEYWFRFYAATWPRSVAKE